MATSCMYGKHFFRLIPGYFSAVYRKEGLGRKEYARFWILKKIVVEMEIMVGKGCS